MQPPEMPVVDMVARRTAKALLDIPPHTMARRKTTAN